MVVGCSCSICGWWLRPCSMLWRHFAAVACPICLNTPACKGKAGSVLSSPGCQIPLLYACYAQKYGSRRLKCVCMPFSALAGYDSALPVVILAPGCPFRRRIFRGGRDPVRGRVRSVSKLRIVQKYKMPIFRAFSASRFATIRERHVSRIEQDFVK